MQAPNNSWIWSQLSHRRAVRNALLHSCH